MNKGNFKEHDVVKILKDMPAIFIKCGDTGTIVHCYGIQDFYEVEFKNGTLVDLHADYLALIS